MKTCADCVSFEEKTRMGKPLGYGLCAKKSTYSGIIEPGQIVPPGAKRAPKGEMGSAVVQYPTDPSCLQFVEKTA